VLLPIDSEHNAIFQCMPQDFARGLRRSVCVGFADGSGGPFRRDPWLSWHMLPRAGLCASELVHGAQDFRRLGQHDEQGLELIEACWLFDAKPSRSRW
jgi:1-deoxy-D-xylulose-5-phosphate reductoisomerase